MPRPSFNQFSYCLLALGLWLGGCEQSGDSPKKKQKAPIKAGPTITCMWKRPTGAVCMTGSLPEICLSSKGRRVTHCPAQYDGKCTRGAKVTHYYNLRGNRGLELGCSANGGTWSTGPGWRK